MFHEIIQITYAKISQFPLARLKINKNKNYLLLQTADSMLRIR